MTDYFKSVPQEGAVINDWTKETLVLDIENSLGETFHFEIQPNEKDNLAKRSSDNPITGKTVVNLLLPRRLFE